MMPRRPPVAGMALSKQRLPKKPWPTPMPWSTWGHTIVGRRKSACRSPTRPGWCRFAGQHLSRADEDWLWGRGTRDLPASGKVNYFRPFPADDIQGAAAAAWANAWDSRKSLSWTTASSTARVLRMCSWPTPASSGCRSLAMRRRVGRCRFPCAVDEGQGLRGRSRFMVGL